MKPCIRGLKKFKNGCPENSSCPAWIETLGRHQPVVIKKCVDIVTVDLLWDLNCNMIGTQQATESNRNMTALHSLVAINARTPEDLFRVATKNLEQSRDKLLLEVKGQDDDS